MINKKNKKYPANFKKIKTTLLNNEDNTCLKYVSVKKLQSKCVSVMECFHPISRIINISNYESEN